MPRTGRIVVCHYPHHVVQRGHNKQIVFADPRDFEYYLATLAEFKDVYDVKVYAFCLMTNHIHLVLQPGGESTGLGQLMKRLAGRQTRYVNRQEGRSGTLWESRYKSSPIQTDAYLLACCRYVELNPVRARMIATPDDYPWSSYVQRSGKSTAFSWLDTDPCFESLGLTELERQQRYRDFVLSAIPDGEWELIHEAIQRGQLTGQARFINEVEVIVGRRIEHRKQGRPRKRADE